MSAGKVILWTGAGLVATIILVRFGLSAKYEALYKAAGDRWGVEPEKLHALALQETRETPGAVSAPNSNGTRDYGLMQINSANLARLGLTADTALEAARSVNAAAQLLSQTKAAAPWLSLSDEFAVYNAGLSSTGEPHVNAHGIYTNLAYVASTLSWYVLVWLARLSLIQRV